MKKLLVFALVATAGFAAEGYKVLNKIKIGGAGGWDYVVADDAHHRLYVSHGASVSVLATRRPRPLIFPWSCCIGLNILILASWQSVMPC